MACEIKCKQHCEVLLVWQKSVLLVVAKKSMKVEGAKGQTSSRVA